MYAHRGLAIAIAVVAAACSSPASNAPPTPPATAVQASPSRPQTLGPKLGPVEIGASAQDVENALGRPTSVTITHGIGSAEWIYDGRFVVRLRGTREVPRDVWHVIAYAPSAATTVEGFRVGGTKAEFQRMYASFRLETFMDPGGPTPQDQVEATDGKLVLLANFGPEGRATYLSLKVSETRP